MKYNKLMLSGVLSIVLATGLLGASVAIAKNDDEHENQNQRRISGTQVHIEENGRVLVRGAIVRSISSSTLNAATVWGSGSMDWRVRTDGDTDFLRRNGGRGMLSEISVGDTISFQGRITEEGPMPTVLAKIVKNWSVEKTRGKLSGVIQTLSASSSHFMMTVSGQGSYDVTVSSTTEIRKGTTTIPFASLMIGNEVKVEGLLNSEAHTVAAERIEVKLPHVSPLVRLRTIFDGTVTTVPGSTTPTTLRARVSGRDMSVDVSSATLLVNKLWRRIIIGDIRTDHKVQIYGASAVDGTSILDVTLLRDQSL